MIRSAPSGSRTRQPQRPLVSPLAPFLLRAQRRTLGGKSTSISPHLYAYSPLRLPSPGGARPVTHSPPLTAGSAAVGRRGEAGQKDKGEARRDLMGAAPSQHIAESPDTAPTAARRAASVKERQGEGRGGGRRGRGRWGGSQPSFPAWGERAAGWLFVVTWGWEVRIGKKRRGEAEVLVTSWHHLSAVRPGAESPPYSEAV